jgi:hypothetical protein
MNTRHTAAFLALLGAATVTLSASGQSGIYAIVEKVIVEPASGPAERIQVWGAFALMERSSQGFTSYVFRKPVLGYMYFRIPGNATDAENARREWKDLTSLAGTKQPVAFGYWDQYRGDSMPTVRTGDAKPQNPDPYLMDVGLVKLNSSGDATVAALLKLVDR